VLGLDIHRRLIQVTAPAWKPEPTVRHHLDIAFEVSVASASNSRQRVSAFLRFCEFRVLIPVSSESQAGRQFAIAYARITLAQDDLCRDVTGEPVRMSGWAGR
jgi:hypothetical protein